MDDTENTAQEVADAIRECFTELVGRGYSPGIINGVAMGLCRKSMEAVFGVQDALSIDNRAREKAGWVEDPCLHNGGLDVYIDTAGEWRWRFLSANGTDIIADSSEGYKNKVDCENGFRALAKILYNYTADFLLENEISQLR